MVRHIVMFKLKPFENVEAKMLQMNNIKKALEELVDVIDCLKSAKVNFNINENEKWDLILETELDSLKDVSIYANHPSHVAVGKKFIAPFKEDRACVDYEC